MSARISIVILLDPDSMIAAESVLSTLDSVRAHYSGDLGELEFFAAAMSGKSKEGKAVLDSVQKELPDGISLSYAGADDISGRLTGDYVFLLNQGAVVKSGDIADMAAAADENMCVLTEPKRNGIDKLPASGNISIFGIYKLLDDYAPSIMIRRDGIDFGGFFRNETEAWALLLDLYIRNEGVFYYSGLEVEYMHAGALHEECDHEYVIKHLIQTSKEKAGFVSEYIQTYIIQLLSVKMEEHAHIEGIHEYLQDISDELICTDSDIDVHQQVYLLSLKYGKDVRPELYVTDASRLCFHDIEIGSINAAVHMRVSISTVKDDKLILEGMTDIPYLLGENYKLCASDENDELAPLEIMPLTINDRTGFDGEYYYRGEQYKVEFPLKKSKKFSFYIEDEDGRVITLNPKLGDYSRLNFKIPVSYFSMNGYLVKCVQGIFSVSKYNKKLHRKYEWGYMKSLVKSGKLTSAIYRLLYYIDKKFQKKPVWLVMDRPHIAKDNGEHMFRYLMTTDAAKDHDIYFVLKKSSRDYERMKKVGKVLVHNSLKHRLKFLEAQVLIAAAANKMTVNAFGKSGFYYRDLYNFDFIYLRHGVSHNDQSDWLHRLKKNIRILVATCRPEYEGILQGGYGYTEREVKLTGLSRYDNLYDDKEKIIAILPTWRKNLEGELKYRSSERDYIPGFKDTEYFRFYNSLINDERLLKVMRDNGYKGVFYLHPVFAAQYADFKGNDTISVGNGVADYQQVFKESSLMVTDFSSVAFDFAYLKKPVIYSQFDEDSFYRHHTWGKGYFTYREDGFGPITTTLDETVQTMIDYIESGCEMKPEYIEKVDNFFAYTDRNNRKRIYEAIVEAEKDR